MDRNEKSMEWTLAGEDVAAFLRRLLDCVEGKEAFLAGDMAFEVGTKVRLSVRRRESGLTAKVRLRRVEGAPAEGEGAGDEGAGDEGAGDETSGADRPGAPDDYKRLKKRMSRSFSAIEEAASAGATPEPGLLTSFLADARAMCTYPGKGEPHYAPFLAACAALEQAVRSGSPERIRAASADVAAVKRAAHARYK